MAPAGAVSFRLRRDCTDDERAALLARIEALDGVASAGWLDPAAATPGIRRLGHVRLTGTAPAAAVIAALLALPDVESASAMARRHTL